jgi:hypothetical protein
MGDIAGTEICEQTAPAVADALERALTRPAGTPFHGRAAMRRFDQAATVTSLIEVYKTVLYGRTRSSTSAAYGCS